MFQIGNIRFDTKAFKRLMARGHLRFGYIFVSIGKFSIHVVVTFHQTIFVAHEFSDLF